MTQIAKLFGDKSYLPIDVISVDNATVTFPKAQIQAICNAVQLQGQRGVQRLIDLSSGDAVAVTGPYNGQLTINGMIVYGRSPIDIVNKYSDMCNIGSDQNSIVITFTSACDNKKKVIVRAKGCILLGHGLTVQAGESLAVVSSLVFFVSSAEMEEKYN